jgi:hypothetical protein
MIEVGIIQLSLDAEFKIIRILSQHQTSYYLYFIVLSHQLKSDKICAVRHVVRRFGQRHAQNNPTTYSSGQSEPRRPLCNTLSTMRQLAT